MNMSPYPKANDVPESLDGDISSQFLQRSFIADQQEKILRGGNHVDSSSFPAPTATTNAKGTRMGHQGYTNEKHPHTEACGVCLQASRRTCEELQVAEDRKLAASLAAVNLEEQQNRSHENTTAFNGENTETTFLNGLLRSHGDMNRFMSSYDQGLHYAIPYQDQGLSPQERRKDRHSPIPPVAAATMELNNQIQGYRPRQQIHDQSNELDYEINNRMERNIDQYEVNTIVDDDTCVYIGDYNIIGQRHGSHGELIWDSGDRYVGTFVNGMRSGQGTFFFRDGSGYTGDWKENQMHGCGQRKFANGDIYVGQFLKGRRSGGPWKYRFCNGDLYVGGWDTDQFHGFGRYFFADGSVLEGNFVHGIKQGKFKRQLPSEDLDILRFEDNKLVGQGVRWNAKRTKTWLLEIRNANGRENITKRSRAPDALISRNRSHRHAAHRFVRRIGNLTRRRYPHPSRMNHGDIFPSIDESKNIKALKSDRETTTSTLYASKSQLLSSSLLPIDNLEPVFPQERLNNVIKKSTRIPTSQAVSIGYDCETGTDVKPDQISFE